ncbi:EutP/PduV family microcompartment system protein [Maledivibacter halophilus]|uniref:Ethanolamine utilization protein EutP n=1 Tax=Maledivibacter halophilus TaxID=36842 RepID=A0A1T5MJZ5_9FIRM|nr:EutP/PduV family microcompartment system protein [Maledivibacter halophilus]SKC88546.1 ethanolamine utilization protein EutP [Maledivibacter halophilus]
MKRKRVMILGPGKSGKTSLANILNGVEGPAKRTPNMVYGKYTLDVPGAYLESPWMHQHLIAAQQDAYCVIMISDPEQRKRSYAPGFANSFRIPLIGVITKVDIASKEHQEACEQELISAGIKPPFHYISLLEGTGIEKLIEQVKAYQQG